jgi:hypothetical protein
MFLEVPTFSPWLRSGGRGFWETTSPGIYCGRLPGLFPVLAAVNLRLRNEPKADADNANVIANLPNGQIVQALDGQEIGGFIEVETDFQGVHYRGFAAAKFLKPK